MAKTVEDSAPAQVFQGYDSVTGAGRSTAVGGQTTTTGGTSELTCQVCQTTKDLARTLNISGSLSVGFSDIGSINAKAQFISNLKLTTNSISIVVYVRHVQGTESATNVGMASGVNPPGTNDAIKEFFLGYGDSYVSSLTRGGEYYAVYVFYAETQEEKTTLSGEISHHGIYDGVAVDVNLQTNIDNFVKTTTSRTSLYQNISGIGSISFPDGPGIVDFARNFPSLDLDAPAIISFETTGYENVPNFGTFGAVPGNRGYFVGTEVLDGQAANLVSVQQLQAQIAWLKDIYNLYGFLATSDTALLDAENDATVDLRAINTQIQQWEQDPTQDFIDNPPSWISLTYGTPTVNYTISTFGPWGGGGGGDFNDVPASPLEQHFRLSSIQLRAGDWIDALIVAYEINGDSQPPLQHGANGGSQSTQLTIPKGTLVSSVTGTGGTTNDPYVGSFGITLSDGRSLAGGAGQGGPFSWSPTSGVMPPEPPLPVPPGSVFLGFGGRSGDYLDALSVVYATISPANWEGGQGGSGGA